MEPRIITVEGNIGSGKTSLARNLAADMNARLILETFADNPFLQKFFLRQEDYALGMEMFFMAERYEQLKAELGNVEIFREKLVMDYLFCKSLLYAKVNLDEMEFSLFQKIFNILNPRLPSSDLIVYLHADTERLVRNIFQRGRTFELSVRREYLQKIESVYFEYFRQHQDQVILIIDVSDADFVKFDRDYQKIREIIQAEHTKGISRFTITSGA